MCIQTCVKEVRSMLGVFLIAPPCVLRWHHHLKLTVTDWLDLMLSEPLDTPVSVSALLYCVTVAEN